MVYYFIISPMGDPTTRLSGPGNDAHGRRNKIERYNRKMITILFILLSIYCASSFKYYSSHQSGTRYSMFSNNDENNDETSEDAIGAPVGPLPSVSSKINFGKRDIDTKYDLWVVGAGTLGNIIGNEWKKLYPNSKVLMETRTNKRHDEYKNNNLIPKLRGERCENDCTKSKNVVICIPPSAADDYLAEISDACRLWAGGEGGGKLVFTSSISVYGESIGNVVNENFRLDTRSSRSTKMIAAEEAVLYREGCVLRLAGLYTEQRGAHTFWLNETSKNVDSSSDGIINLLHYVDAARATVACLHNGKLSTVYLAVDDVPMTRKEICEAALDSGLFNNRKMPLFSSDIGPKTKICDGSWTRNELKWSPLYPSFDEYMRSTIGKNPYTRKSTLTANAIEKEKQKKSSLWIPGDDDLLEL